MSEVKGAVVDPVLLLVVQLLCILSVGCLVWFIHLSEGLVSLVSKGAACPDVRLFLGSCWVC